MNELYLKINEKNILINKEMVLYPRPPPRPGICN